jgi:hypothetical protein
MNFLDGLKDAERNVRNKRLLDDISNLSQDIKASITELSDKAQKLNELTDQYKESQSESNTGKKVESKPSGITGYISSFFSSKPEPEAPAPATDDAAAAAAAAANQLQSGVDSPTTGDNIEADSLSAASTAQLASPGNAIDQSAISRDIIPQSPFKDSNSISDNSLSLGPDMFSSDMMQKPLEQASPSLQPASLASPALPSSSASPALQPASSEPVAKDASTLSKDQQTLQVPREQDNLTASSNIGIGMGGKSRKKSKRSKQTIRKANKNSNRVTKKQKNTSTTTTTDNKANTQGLAQALLQAQGQA